MMLEKSNSSYTAVLGYMSRLQNAAFRCTGEESFSGTGQATPCVYSPSSVQHSIKDVNRLDEIHHRATSCVSQSTHGWVAVRGPYKRDTACSPVLPSLVFGVIGHLTELGQRSKAS